GLSIADVGASKIEASGKVYHLNKLADFAGNYTAAAAGITISGGGSATAMRNQNGVVINVLSTTQGLKFALAASGMSLKIKKGLPAPGNRGPCDASRNSYSPARLVSGGLRLG